MQPRFLSLADVCEILQVPMPTVRALVRSGELKAIQVGGKGTWRVENSALEAYIEHRYRVEEQRRATEPQQ
ncbi:MAG: helix-turn-helix domain-containing protein [Beutenbergiaceae bacterium]